MKLTATQFDLLRRWVEAESEAAAIDKTTDAEDWETREHAQERATLARINAEEALINYGED